MADKAWKRFERKIAAYFGTTRALMKGTGQKKDIGPEDDFPLMLDCKHRPMSAWRLMAWFEELEVAAVQETHARWPVLCFKEPGMSIEYALVRQGPLVAFIMQRAKSLDPEIFVLRDGGNLKKSSLVAHWKIVRDRTKKLNGKKGGMDDLIPMLRLFDKSRQLDLLVLSPKDLARIFYAGGLLKKEMEEDQCQKEQSRLM